MTCSEAIQACIQKSHETPAVLIAQLTAAARRSEVPPERMVIVFKRMLERLPAMQALPSDERKEVHTRLVHAAIEAYFGAAEDRADMK